MENISSSDYNRMIRAIEQECDARINEIRIEAQTEYESHKTRLIEVKETEAQRKYEMDVKELKKELQRQEGKLRGSYRITIGEMKSFLLEKIIDEVKISLKMRSFDFSLLDEILEKVKSVDAFIFVAEHDKSRVEGYLLETGILNSYEIKTMPSEGIGGVILCSKDGKEIWDNSFETRLERIIDEHLDKVSKEVF